MQFIIFSLAILLSSGLYAQSPEALVSEGIQHFSEKKWDEAERSFNDALKIAPNDPNVLSNLALVQIEKANNILAYALWRKALYYHPFFSPAQQGLDYLQQKANLQITEASRLAMFFHNLYRSPPLYSYLIVCIFLFLFLQSLYTYLLQKKEAKEGETTPPAFSIKLGIYFVLLIASLYFTTNQYLDRHTKRGLSLVTSATRLGPSEASPNLFSLNPGDSIDILNENEQWLQIRNSQDQRAWIEKDKIFIF